ncbi:ATP-binding cassette domain-containing protein [Nonlabens ponticola]|uniref:ATP-binding cassette domain-containing protein n=1 Tax=Nonlabens ponticola TaxID=2496866 RepID=A0A3S9MV96_9FLAO|nr:ATP-binding cassette domain-containing protein [Nonlabens ponticola]AZQ43060.1 ATP-binding cassette domain-containing protein [Nonlabens ponticola]
MTQTLSIQNLCLDYGNNSILNNIELKIETGNIYGLLGLNGAGKSSMMKALSGLNKKASFRAHHNDKAIDLNNHKLQTVGYLPQDPFLMKSLSVVDTVAYWYPDYEIQDQILYDPMIHQFHKTKVGKLSMGEQRFLELSLIMQLPHPFLMLDEPFSGLAPLQIERSQELIKVGSKDKGIVISDHYYDNVIQITHINWMLRDGNLNLVDKENVETAYRIK